MAEKEQAIVAGRLLRSSITGFVAGCSVSQSGAPSFGALVKTPLEQDYWIYGLIHDIHIDDDGLVRQLVTSEPQGIAGFESVIADNRMNRNVPVEMSVLAVGYQLNGQVSHLLPPRPPLSLDKVYLCDAQDLRAFTGAGRFGYFRHILRAADVPIGELLAAHLQQARRAHLLAKDNEWSERATRELITLLRDDYATLVTVLGAISDALTFDGGRS